MKNNIYGGQEPKSRCEMYLEDGSGKAKDNEQVYHGRQVVTCEVEECPYGNLRDFDGVCISGGIVEFPGLFEKLEKIAKSQDSEVNS